MRDTRFHFCLTRAMDYGDNDGRGLSRWRNHRVAAEASRMKAANEIPPDIRITDFARDLARGMDKAAVSNRSIRPIKSISIENKLRDWGLWPLPSSNSRGTHLCGAGCQGNLHQIAPHTPKSAIIRARLRVDQN